MTIRILSDGQYRVSGVVLDELDSIDNAIIAAIEADDEQGFRQAFARVIDLIRTKGQRLPDDFLGESELILPPDDTTLAEARKLFADYPSDLI